MFYRGSKTREPKLIREKHVSTPDEKLRRHKNKKRIWLRAIKRLTYDPVIT